MMGKAAKTKVVKEAYAVVRSDEQHEYIMPDEIHCLPEDALKLAEDTNRLIPAWAKANPIQRVVKVTITEE